MVVDACMAVKRRAYRIGEKIQSVLAQEVLRLSDPRFYLVTITSVVVSSDLRHAKVYWVATGGTERCEEVSEAFESASGNLRSRVSKDLGMRFAPQLSFYYDDSYDVRDEVARLLSRIEKP